MKLNWIKGLSEQEKGEIKLLFSSNARLRAHIVKMLLEKKMSMHKKATLEIAYESPNWALKQADAVGYERAIQEIISLFE
jgi:hypothetical protein